jgi:hypothetical protein
MRVGYLNRRSAVAHSAAEGHPFGINSTPWPGPGNSEGPVDLEGWTQKQKPKDAGRGALSDADRDESASAYLTTDPWPGPGDSEGARP